MNPLKHLSLITILSFYLGTAFSQSSDSLSVFPNPFSISAMVHFEIAQSDTISLTVYIIFGNTMKSFYQSAILPSGIYNETLLGDSLANGIHYVKLDIGTTKSITKTAIKIDATASVEDNLVVDKIHLYPNPTNGFLFIEGLKIEKIRILGLDGHELLSSSSANGIDVSNLASGHYFIEVNGGARKMFLKR